MAKAGAKSAPCAGAPTYGGRCGSPTGQQHAEISPVPAAESQSPVFRGILSVHCSGKPQDVLKHEAVAPGRLPWLMDTGTTSPANAKKLISTSFHRKSSTLIFPFVFFSLQAQLVQNPSLPWLSTARDQAGAVSAGAERSPGAGGRVCCPHTAFSGKTLQPSCYQTEVFVVQLQFLPRFLPHSQNYSKT